MTTGDFDHQVRLWEVATGQLLETWSGHRWEIEKVAFSPDGAWLASGSHDGSQLASCGEDVIARFEGKIGAFTSAFNLQYTQALSKP